MLKKQLIESLVSKAGSINGGQMIVALVDDTDGFTPLLKGVPTDDYLAELKYQEDMDFKARDLKKYYEKMDRINGNLPMDEMLNEAHGTRLSNVHITDLNRLNDLKIQSAVFN